MNVTIIKALSAGVVFACAGAVMQIWANQWPLGLKLLCAACIGVIVWTVCYLVDTKVQS